MACDDSYIHARIAKNMSLYGLPYFDITQPLMTSTSIVWTLLLSLLYKLPASLYVWIAILNSLSITIMSLLWCQLNNTNRVRNYWLAFIFILCSIHIAAFDQMETPFACFGLFFCLWLLKTHKFLALGLVLGILPFIRPELILISFLIGTYYCKNYKQTKQAILACIIIISSISIYLIFIFQGLTPHSITVKSLIYEIEFWQTLNDLLPGRESWSLIFRLAPLLVLIQIFRLDIWSKLVAIYIVLLSFAYISKNTFIFSWYPALIHCPLLFIAFTLCVKKNYKYIVIIFCLNLPFLFELYLSCTNQYRYSLRSARVQSYLKLSKLIAFHTDDKSRLMVAEIGAISKYYPGIILDGVGLTTPEALNYHPLNVPEDRVHGSIGAIPKKFFENELPDLMIGYDLFILGVSKSEKLKDYVVIPLPLFGKEWMHQLNNENTFWGSRNLYLFIRKDFKNIYNLVNDLKKF